MRQQQIQRVRSARVSDQEAETDARSQQDGAAELSPRTASFLRKLDGKV